MDFFVAPNNNGIETNVNLQIFPHISNLDTNNSRIPITFITSVRIFVWTHDNRLAKMKWLFNNNKINLVASQSQTAKHKDSYFKPSPRIRPWWSI